MAFVTRPVNLTEEAPPPPYGDRGIQPSHPLWYIAPPPYEPRVDRTPSQSTLSQSEANDEEAESQHCELTTTPTERMRRFLLHCLAIDYGLTDEVSEKLQKHDWFYFTRLSSKCYYIHRTLQPTERYPLLHWPRECDDPEIQECVLTPARELDIPIDLVVLMLRLFVRCTPIFGQRNRSTLDQVWLRYGLHVLAWKLYLDRNVLFKTLLTDRATSLNRSFERKFEKYSARWFKSLVGPDEYCLTWTAYTYRRELDLSPEDPVFCLVPLRLPKRRASYELGNDDYCWVGFLRKAFAAVDDPVPLWWVRVLRPWIAWRQRGLFEPEDEVDEDGCAWRTI
ncbi:hypothetical protein B0A50_03923 [Salinomyces thailandicus]|uniref:Uncharacterized protein n=1 Tax=Salinomyces thailandicus TaxID=706561 RepID=A0A4U0U248_9PEZI|nr:hypothetical protein B0A50_03923 [Salinomyces thailandica]